LKNTTITTALAAAATVAAAGAVGIVGTPLASAEDVTTQTIGSQAKLVDGNVIQGWTISNLKPSTDVIPYQATGTLWEATATDEAIQGAATPIVSNLNARAQSGETYRALFGVATAQGVNPATISQGQKTSGKVYFDVTGQAPASVIYNAGGQDLLAWVQAPPASTPQTGTGSTPYRSASPATSAPTATTPAPAPAAAEATPAPTTTAVTPPPAGSQGTPVPAGSQGTPLPPGSQGTPLPPGSEVTLVPASPEGAPRPASVEEMPVQAPEGSQGTPLPPGSEGTPVAPTTTTVIPAP
jgi:hypothetical protein